MFTGQPATAFQPSTPGRTRPWLAVFVAVWVLVVVGGTGALWRYSLTPGQTAQPPSGWPERISLRRADVGATLIMTVHPQCPCSRASVDELAVLMARGGGKLTCYVLFAQPCDSMISSESQTLWQSASHIPGVTAIHDRGGVITKSFGGATSGQVFVYDASGALQFSGGMTESRGHEGDNDGLTAIQAIVHSQTPAARTTPVYGCSIW